MSKLPDFLYRHIGPDAVEQRQMLNTLGVPDLETLMTQTIPDDIRRTTPLNLPEPLTEAALEEDLNDLASRNRIWRSYIGYGFYGTHMPGVIRRNILENPSWYTSYTPYQAEISQGRLEALLNYQTMLTELTGMELANASLLDDATAAAEAMLMLFNLRSRQQKKAGANRFFVDEGLFPHVLEVVKTRARFKGIELVTDNPLIFRPDESVFGALLAYPLRSGEIPDLDVRLKVFREAEIKTAVHTDLLMLTLLRPPGHFEGVDIVTGGTQRFGLPLGYGGPHTGFLATRMDYKRQVPGRIIGVSVDARGNRALRMALQTREQHIKREHATSNICTAQALTAIMNGMYAVYHGREGLQRIARRVHSLTARLAVALENAGIGQRNKHFFDTLRLEIPHEKIRPLAEAEQINLNYFEDPGTILISLDELTTEAELAKLIDIIGRATGKNISLPEEAAGRLPKEDLRTDEFMHQEVFRRYRSETELMRYIKSLERKDLSLTHSMIPLGSCTMKLNAAAELFPLSDGRWANLHPFVPAEQAAGYRELFRRLGDYLLEITGLDAISFQPNSGAAGEYTGLSIIKSYFEARGQHQRDVALIPASAHGTNPASAVMAGLRVVVVKTLENGNIDTNDLAEKARKYADNLAVFMVTYPSTHGVFEKDIVRMTEIVHRHGGLVYMDGANMNAQMGLTSPAAIGADVCHLNLHKTFAMPHGGGGPGVGPVAVKAFLKDFLPNHALVETGEAKGHQVAAAPYGSAMLLPVSYAYIRLMGAEGLRKSSQIAILNANYLEHLISPYFPTLYKGEAGRVAHEFIADLRPFKHKVSVMDVAKRLMDYGYHAPTVSFPVAGTLMIEPTESESKAELDRFAEAMEAIYREIEAVEEGNDDAPLFHAPHTAEEVTADVWFHGYSRQKAVYPLPWIAANKYWPPVARVDDAYGDRHLHCTCDPTESYASEES